MERFFTLKHIFLEKTKNLYKGYKGLYINFILILLRVLLKELTLSQDIVLL